MTVGSLLEAADVGEADVCDAEVAAGSAVGYGAAVGAAACGAAVAIARGRFSGRATAGGQYGQGEDGSDSQYDVKLDFAELCPDTSVLAAKAQRQPMSFRNAKLLRLNSQSDCRVLGRIRQIALVIASIH